MVAARVTEPPPEPTVSTRDRRTLEIRRVLPLPVDVEPGAHTVDVFFFFPRAFGVSARTYPRDDFFRDTTAHLRLAAVHLTLAELADLDHPENPGALLRRALPRVVSPDAPKVESLVVLAQMFGAELADAIEHETRAILELLRARPRRHKRPKARIGKKKRELVDARVVALCQDGDRALAAIRRVRAKASAYHAVAHPSLFAALMFAEEHATSVFQESIARLARAIDGHAALHDGTGRAVRLHLTLAAAARDVVTRRTDQGFAEPWNKSPETYVFRTGVVKKELQRVLYVSTRGVARDPIFANTAAMVAAGLAATWATLAQVPLWAGNLSTRGGMVLFAGAVGAYMVKDRIKEWTRQTLSKKLLVWDHDRKMTSASLRHVGLADLNGRARERLIYVAADAVPPDVKAVRQAHRTVRGVTHELEEVLHYRRVVTLEPAKHRSGTAFGVRELIRYSLAEVLDRLDDATENVAYFDPLRGTFVERELPKVYHLNVVVRASSGAPGGPSRLSRYRVIVDRDGIRRVEPVLLPRALAQPADGSAPPPPPPPSSLSAPTAQVSVG